MLTLHVIFAQCTRIQQYGNAIVGEQTQVVYDEKTDHIYGTST